MPDLNKEGPKKIKVLYVFAALPVGGAEELLYNQVAGLDKNLFTPLVCVISEKGPIGELIEKLGIPVIPLHRMKSNRFDWKIIRDIYRIIKRENIDLVHTQLYDGNKYGRLAAFLAKVPGIVSSYLNVYSRRRIKYHLINWALSFTNHRIIACSQAVKESAVHYDRISPDKFVVIYNCIDPSKFKRDSDTLKIREKFGVRPDDFLLGVIARLEEQKGHIYLLEALGQLIPKYPRIKCLVIGDGKLRHSLEKKTEQMGLSSSILFVGTQKPTTPILNILDLFLLPSLWEGLSLAMLEAMAMGTPVLATAVGGAAEIIRSGENGILIPPRDVAGLVSSIQDAIMNPSKYLAMGGKGKETFYQNFTKAHHITMLQNLYLEILGVPQTSLPGIKK
jgi:glycosyltransferase involved in cell wall biosynthesis